MTTRATITTLLTLTSLTTTKVIQFLKSCILVHWVGDHLT